jgi:hypothetical protein
MVEIEAQRHVWLNQVGARRPAPRAGRGAKEGLDLLCRAYGADPGHPGVLAALAACSLLRGDTVRAGALAAAAAEAADADDARAEALSLQARRAGAGASGATALAIR